MNEVFIYEILRTPTGKRGGAYKYVPPEMLGAFLIDKLIESNKYKLGTNGEVILAHSIGLMGNPARNCLLRSKLDSAILATSIDFQCGGAYKAIQLGMAQIASGYSDWIIAGGIESNSLQAERNYHINDPRRKSSQLLKNAEFSPYPTSSLAESAEMLAEEYNLTKEELLDWTISSHNRAANNFRKGLFESHVIPYNEKVWQDESIRTNITKELLQKAQQNTLIDRTNTADFHDGAGISLLGNKVFGEKNNLKPLARINKMSFVGIDPNHSPAGALTAAKALLENTNVDLFEICESYAAKPLAFAKKYEIAEDRINILGSNLAMGHPFAASGIINMLNLYLALKSKSCKSGIIAAGIAGGLGASMVLEIDE